MEFVRNPVWVDNKCPYAIRTGEVCYYEKSQHYNQQAYDAKYAEMNKK